MNLLALLIDDGNEVVFADYPGFSVPKLAWSVASLSFAHS
jgi:hypothetical protein